MENCKSLLTLDEREKLIEEAKKARNRSYAPYSLFNVGSSVLTSDNKVYSGFNIENASFSVCICAERTAMVSAILAGSTQFKAVCVVSSSDGYCYPCGACRDFISEFSRTQKDDVIVLVVKENGEFREHYLKDLLPYGFVLK